MPFDPAKAELLRSLARLVRGLSALFWGLPLALVIYVQTAWTNWLDLLDGMAIFPALLVTGLIFFGLMQLRHFQKQERIWIRALDRAQILVFINFGLVPFLYWWQKAPHVTQFAAAVGILAFSSILFLFNLNYVLQRLTAMLPDEALRMETRLFTSFNRALLLTIPFLVLIYVSLLNVTRLPGPVIAFLDAIAPFSVWLILFLVMMPMAMTMALIWKIKEVIFNSVFDGDR
ncbi:MAG: hypothetical protein ACK4UN_09005 [Limisphaerales bacterium]